jgi:hypothetical protein
MDEQREDEGTSAIARTTNDLQAIKVEPEEILYLVQEMNELRKEGHEIDFYMTVAVLHNRYGDDHMRMHCLSTRMHCLSVLMKDPRMRGWSMQAIEAECVLTNEAVFHATAKCALLGDDRTCYFSADEFFEVVLKETGSEGTA